MPKITKTAVEALVPGQTIWDSETRGFGARRQVRDAAYILKVRFQEQQKFITIGKHGSPWTPDTARQEAKRLLGLVAAGQDPTRERAAAKAVPTVRQLAEAYMAEHVGKKCKPGTARGYRSNLDNHILPALGDRRATDITPADVSKLHAELSETPVTANRSLDLLGTLFEWGQIFRGLPPHFNPARHVTKYKEQDRQRYLSGEELGRLGDVLLTAETVGLPWIISEEKARRPAAKHTPKNAITKIGSEVAAAFRLLLLTGARLNEILSLQWANVDLVRGMLLLPDSKTGQKTIVLSTAAIAVLEDLPRVSPYVIPGKPRRNKETGEFEERPRADVKRPWKNVLAHAGIKNLRRHDLRHTNASVGVGEGLGLPIIGKILGHASAKTTERYAHLDIDPVRRAIEIVGEKISPKLPRASLSKGDRNGQ